MSLIPIGTHDVRQIAGMLSGHGGMFSADDLVNYGKTVIVKPGAATEEGRVMTGADVQRLLGPSFSVFPLSVEYGPSVEQALGVFGDELVEDDISEMEREIDSLGGADDLPEDDQDLVGRQGPGLRRSVRLEKKYLDALTKFAKCQTLLDAGRGRIPPGRVAKAVLNPLTPFIWFAQLSKSKRVKDRAQMCDRLHDRLRRIRTKLINKGIDVSRLPRIDDVRGAMYQEWHARQRKAARPAQAGPRVVYVEREREDEEGEGYQRPGYTPVSQEYLRDQAALERELAEQTPEYGADADDYGAGEQLVASSIDPTTMNAYWTRIGEAVKEALDEDDDDPLEAADDLLRDLRAETVGWLGSSVQHDYFGLEGTEFASQYGDDSDLTGEDDGMSGGRGRELPEDDEDLLTARMRVPVAGEDDDLLLGPDADILGADDETGADDDVTGVDDDETGADDETGGDDEATGADGDILGSTDAELAADDETGADADVLGEDLGEDDATGADADVLGEDDATSGLHDNLRLRRVVTPDGRILFDEIRLSGADEMGADDDLGADDETGAVRPPSKGKQEALARRRRALRHELNEAIRRGAPDARIRKLEHELKMIRRQLQSASPTKGVDWSRVRPKRGGGRRGLRGDELGADKAPVVVIAIRKRPEGGKDAAALGRDLAIRDITASVGYNPSDVHLLDVTAAQLVAHGYTPIEAMSAMRQATIPGDWVRGSRAAFPAGDESPMVGPRRVGREVIG